MKNKRFWIVLALVVLFVIYGFSTYNRLVSANEAIDGQWAQVETQYQRRFDLVPQLVNSVKGVLKQEDKIFTEIADARTRYSGASNSNEKVKAASEVESALGRLLVIVENYPQLKSSENVSILMAQLEGAENRISVERSRFNDAVRAYNLSVKKFPSSLIANISNFSERNYFESSEEAKNAPNVNLEY